MVNQRQFSLAYLFLEVFWIAASVGMACQAFRRPPSPDDFTLFFFLSGSFLCFGVAVGGLFHRMRMGAGVAVCLLFLLLLLLVLFFMPHVTY